LAISEKDLDTIYLNIPLRVARDKNISPTAMKLFAIISSLNQNNKTCFAGNAYLAEILDVTTRKISGAVQELIKNNYIKKGEKKGFSRELLVVFNISDSEQTNTPKRTNVLSYTRDYKELPKGNYKDVQNKFGRPVSENSFFAEENNLNKTSSEKEKIPMQKNKENNSSNNTFEDRLISRWNNLENCPNKHERKDTQVYHSAKKYLKQLRNGTFGKGKNFNEIWMKNCKIPYTLLDKKWSGQELMAGLERLTRMFCEGYWPPKKDKLSKSLTSLLYNPATSKSFFLKVMVREPLPEYEAKNFEVVKLVKEFLTCEDDSPEIAFRINQIEVAHNKILKLAENDYTPPFVKDDLLYGYGKLSSFVCSYMTWLRDNKYPGEMLTPNMLGPRSRHYHWAEFLDWFSKTLWGDFYSIREAL